MVPQHLSAPILPPIVPEGLLKRYQCHELADNRFKSAARIMQALWREEAGLPIGFLRTDKGGRRSLGSMISLSAGRAGANFVKPEIAYLAKREVVYRELGASWDADRLFSNLLSSQPLALNLLGALALDLDLGARFLHTAFPDLAGVRLRQVLFEHSPARGAPSLTGDYTAFDALFAYDRPNGATGFVAFEVKFSESMQEPEPMIRPRYDDLAVQAETFIEPLSPALRRNPLQQLFREHCLAIAIRLRGDFAEGRFVVVSPARNYLVGNAVGAYRCQLEELRPDQIQFDHFTLEHAVDLLTACDEADLASLLSARYCGWDLLDAKIERFLSCEGPEAAGTEHTSHLSNSSDPALPIAGGVSR